MVLVIGGPPCLNLTSYSKGKGALGLCGPYSFNLFSIPLIGRTIQECRPDTLVHGIVENAGSIQKLHLDFLARFLAIGVPSHIPHYDPVGRGNQPPWSYAGRNRIFATTLSTPVNPPFPSMRPVPWEPGWVRLFDTPMPTLMTSRERDLSIGV